MAGKDCDDYICHNDKQSELAQLQQAASQG